MAILTLPGLVLLCWTHPWVAGVVLLLTLITSGKEKQGFTPIKHSGFRIFVEMTGLAAASIGYWKFPYFHPVVAQTLAVITILFFVFFLIIFLKKLERNPVNGTPNK